MDMIATVVIPTYGRPSYVLDALLSIQSQDFDGGRYEILAVDNGPVAEAKRVVEQVNRNGWHSVRCIREPKVGLHNARHAGAEAARGEMLVYVDDDVIVHNGWLAAMMGPFADPQVACVGGKVIPQWEEEPPAWLSQFSGGYLSLLDLGEEQVNLKWPQAVHGCNMAVRTSVLHEVGGFNPDAIGDRRLIWLRGDGETGLCKKIYDAGYGVVYAPRAWVYHRIPASRLTPEYFHWRAFIQGISDSYSYIREHRSRLRMLRHARACFTRAVRLYLNSIRDPDDHQVKDRADACYWYGRGQHQLRVALSHKLRRHVLQGTYL